MTPDLDARAAQRCRQCGARLEFAAGQAALQCPFCGAKNELAPSSEAQRAAASEEFDYHQWLQQVADEQPLVEARAVRCTRCGATSSWPAHTVADRCGFCSAPLVAGDATTCRQIKPVGIVPFKIDQSDAMARFKAWIRSRWFAPNALKRAYRADHGLQGVYVPYWSYDAASYTTYTGERGEHYYVPQTYTQNGQTKTRMVRRTRWWPASGAVSVPFDDVLVPATTTLPESQVGGIAPWDLSALEPYRDEFVSGFQVQVYEVGLAGGFERAEKIMRDAIHHAVCADIGGDEQRVHSMHPTFSDIRFRHQLLPIWMSSYRYGGKVYRFLVNGQSGAVQGERPWSWWKIGFAVLGALLVMLVLVVVFGDGG